MEVGGVVEEKDEAAADADDVGGAEVLGGDALAVDVSAVDALEIADPPVGADARDLELAAGGVFVVEGQVVAGATEDEGLGGGEVSMATRN